MVDIDAILAKDGDDDSDGDWQAKKLLPEWVRKGMVSIKGYLEEGLKDKAEDFIEHIEKYISPEQFKEFEKELKQTLKELKEEPKLELFTPEEKMEKKKNIEKLDKLIKEFDDLVEEIENNKFKEDDE